MFCTWKGVFRTKYLEYICRITAFNADDMAQVAWHIDTSALKNSFPKNWFWNVIPWQLKYAQDWRKQYHSNKKSPIDTFVGFVVLIRNFVFFCIRFDYIIL